MNIQLVRTNSDNIDFQQLIVCLDKFLTERDKEAHAHCIEYNQLDKIRHVVVVYSDGVAVGCGAIKEYKPEISEIKRMFVDDSARSRGIATKILTELEAWAIELGYTQSILETGKKLPEAVALYEKHGYRRIPNYDQYACMESSVCYTKCLV